MPENIFSLNNLPLGCLGRIIRLDALGDRWQRLRQLGFISGAVIKSLHRSPPGDPTAYQVRGAVIALRAEEAACILVQLIEA